MSPAFQPATNGVAENAMKSLKAGVQKTLKNKISVKVSLTTLRNHYLLMYHNIPHWTTNKKPLEI